MDNEKWIESETFELEPFCSEYKPLSIPSYQRGYEWNAYNVQRLVYSVFDGAKEETFLGTIQIAVNDGKRFIVDGRQRLTTLALLNAVLAKKAGIEPLHNLAMLIDDPALEHALAEITDKEKELKVLATIGNRGDITRLNRKGKDDALKIESIYLRNAVYINTVLESEHFAEKLSKESVNAMFETLFFIVVTIKNRELTQVIRVFDTLNSTGQELSDEAMFKLRYHSFLRTVDSEKTSEEIMKAINEEYKRVDDYNQTVGKGVPVNMGDVLWGYRTYLLTRPEIRSCLQPADMAQGKLSFFETLFSNIEEQCDVLSLDGFRKYVEHHLEYYRFAYPSDAKFGLNTAPQAIDRILPDLLAWSRYGSTWAIVVAFYAAKRNAGMDENQAYSEAVKLAKPIYQTLYYFSVVYQKSVKRIKTSFLWEAFGKTEPADLLAFCSKTIEDEEKNRIKWNYPSFWTAVRQNFYGEYGQAYAFLATIEACDEMKGRKDFCSFIQLVFPWERKANRPQIEHIFCKKLFVEDPSLSSQDKAKLNGLGNLVLLEEKINKNSLKDREPSAKFQKTGNGTDFFHGSTFSSVKRLCNDYDEAIGDGTNYDQASIWLRMVDRRFEAMKKDFTSIFDLLDKVQ